MTTCQTCNVDAERGRSHHLIWCPHYRKAVDEVRELVEADRIELGMARIRRDLEMSDRDYALLRGGTGEPLGLIP